MAGLIYKPSPEVISADIMVGNEIVAYAATGLVSFVTLYSHQVFYKYITKNESKVRNRVEEEVIQEFKNYRKVLKKYTPEAIVDKLVLITTFSSLIDDSKEAFEKHILRSGIFLFLSSVAYVFYFGQELGNIVFAVGLVSLWVLLSNFNELYQNKTKIERYLADEPIEDILAEED